MNVVPGYIVSCNYGEKVSRVIEGIVESEAAFVFLHSVDERSVGNKSEYKGINVPMVLDGKVSKEIPDFD